MTELKPPDGRLLRFCAARLSRAMAQSPTRRRGGHCGLSKRCFLLQRELTAAIFEFGRRNNARCGDPYGMQFTVQFGLPEAQEFVQHGKARSEIVFLPDVALEQG